MRALLDTHFLLWAAGFADRLPAAVYEIMADGDNELYFSTASIWEIAIKQALGRPDFRVDSSALRRGFLETGLGEIPVLGEHAVATAALPLIHKDPFDRMLVAQAIVEGVDLLTADEQLARYPGSIRVF